MLLWECILVRDITGFKKIKCKDGLTYTQVHTRVQTHTHQHTCTQVHALANMCTHIHTPASVSPASDQAWSSSVGCVSWCKQLISTAMSSFLCCQLRAWHLCRAFSFPQSPCQTVRIFPVLGRGAMVQRSWPLPEASWHLNGTTRVQICCPVTPSAHLSPPRCSPRVKRAMAILPPNQDSLALSAAGMGCEEESER